MNPTCPALDVTAAQDAIYRVALSLDAFLVNGLQYGVLQPAVADDFLREKAVALSTDVTALDRVVQGTAGSVEALRRDVTELTDEVVALAAFRTLPFPRVRSSVARVHSLRADCVRQIQALEAALRTPRPFYPSRPPHSTAAVEAFLADLDRAFTDEWSAARRP